jgi:RluA family pseudouridine synthase
VNALRTLTLEVTEAQAGRTIQSLLVREMKLSRGFVSSVKFRPEGIVLNGGRARTSVRVAAGDVLCVDVGDRAVLSGKAAGQGAFEPADLPLSILFEDQDLLIIDKPSGLPVHHSGLLSGTPTVGDWVAFHLGAGAVFHAVSRLDRGTSGVMCIAKSGYIHDRLRRRLHSADFRREYLAVVIGRPASPADAVTLGIAREPGHSSRRLVSPDGAPSRTEYETIASGGGLSLLRVSPLTGRTHQIRVHLAAIGCPLAGDWLYGVSDDSLISRPALHSSELVLTHPLSGDRIHVRAPLPEDFLKLIAAMA